jgi:hypothetical protein
MAVLGYLVEFEKLPPVTAAWLCTKDKYNLPMFSPHNLVGIKSKQKPNSEPNAHCCLPQPSYCQTQLVAVHYVFIV